MLTLNNVTEFINETGGKYMALLKENFGSPDKITIFNMDVNNLKKMNDLFGHTVSYGRR